VVDTTGEAHLISPPFREAYEVVDVKIPLQPRPTLYGILGEWFAQLCLLLSAGIGVYAYRKKD
jgi:apolipoprotein N-acyltransferase